MEKTPKEYICYYLTFVSWNKGEQFTFCKILPKHAKHLVGYIHFQRLRFRLTYGTNLNREFIFSHEILHEKFHEIEFMNWARYSTMFLYFFIAKRAWVHISSVIDISILLEKNSTWKFAISMVANILM